MTCGERGEGGRRAGSASGQGRRRARAARRTHIVLCQRRVPGVVAGPEARLNDQEEELARVEDARLPDALHEVRLVVRVAEQHPHEARLAAAQRAGQQPRRAGRRAVARRGGAAHAKVARNGARAPVVVVEQQQRKGEQHRQQRAPGAARGQARRRGHSAPHGGRGGGRGAPTGRRREAGGWGAAWRLRQTGRHRMGCGGQAGGRAGFLLSTTARQTYLRVPPPPAAPPALPRNFRRPPWCTISAPWPPHPLPPLA